MQRRHPCIWMFEITPSGFAHPARVMEGVGSWSQHSGLPSLILEGTKLEFHGANPNEWYKATFSLREDTSPKQLEAVVTNCPFPKYVGKTVHGIYTIENGKLKFAANEPGNPAVPASFDAKGAREFVFTQK